jgi:hypothetical protein
MALMAFLGSGGVMGQLDEGVPGKDLVEPWNRVKAVVLSLPDTFGIVAESDKRSRLDGKLSQLDERLAALQSQEESVAVSIASNPGFAYDASLRSEQMSKQVSEIEESFDALLTELTLSDRPDVVAARASVASLRQLLHDTQRFERDVWRAIASGGRNEIQALAGRWWAGAMSVESVRVAIAEVRRQRAPAPGSEGRN